MAKHATRFPDQIPKTGWDYGVDTLYLKDLISYWATKFDWRKQEAKINSYPNFKVTIDGLNIHYMESKSSDPHAIPLLLLHGWPSWSWLRFLVMASRIFPKSEA